MPGQRVWVPFGRRRVVGVIVELRDASDVPANKLRAAYELIDDEPTFDAHSLALLTWSAEYYRHPDRRSDRGRTAGALAQRRCRFYEEQPYWRLTIARARAVCGRPAATLTENARSVRSISRPVETRARKLDRRRRRSTAVLRKLAERGLIEEFMRSSDSARPARPHQTTPGPLLNAAQQAAVERICAAFGTFTTWLLDGVTGSGKTEVYLRTIDAVLHRGEQTLVLVPEIALTPQLVARFQRRFDAPLAVLHSALSDGERLRPGVRRAQRRSSHRDRHALSGVRADARARVSSSSMKSTTARSSNKTAFVTPRAISRSSARNARTCRSCSGPRRLRSKASRAHSASLTTRCGCPNAQAARSRRAGR